MVTKRPFFSIFVVLASFFFGAGYQVQGADVRTEPIDAYMADAARWICDAVVDGILIEGDRLSVWAFSSGTARVVDRAAMSADGKTRVKAEILRIAGDGKAPNLGAALRTAVGEAERRPDKGRVAYLLVAASLVETANAEADLLLKRSRVSEHPGWKAVVVGVGMDRNVREGAQAYFDAAGSP